ncbi:MAG TPA: ATPase domain-containing protein, partial [Candidatus Sulfotelmatobacter sp.]|nr:ATPase domain-containing protein [Candidatus Sulfotelmatobacter sp.]
SFREGFHDYSIRRGGLDVYPRLIAAEHNPGFKHEQLSSSVKELDALWGGGIDRGTSTLIMGPAGCGKSTVAASYAIAAAMRGERAKIYLFDEGVETMLVRLTALGLDPAAQIKAGRLSIEQIDPAELSPGEFVARVRKQARTEKSRIVVVDSLNGFLNSMPGEQFLAAQIHELLSYLNQMGLATIMVLAQHGLIGQEMQSIVDVSYLADSVMLFRYFEAEGEVRQAISVLKKRSGGHERSIRELKLNGGLKVGKPLLEFRGVLSGIPESNHSTTSKTTKSRNGRKH